MLALVKAVANQRAAERSYDMSVSELTPVLRWSLPALRKVDLRLDLPEGLRRFIDEVDLGRNEKLVAGVAQRRWRAAGGFEVEAWSDQSVALLWDSSLRELSRHPHGAC